jgi:hypothetical protein
MDAEGRTIWIAALEGTIAFNETDPKLSLDLI